MLDGERVSIRIVEGRIAAIGPTLDPEAGDETLDATATIVSPGLVNAHTHAAMSLFRGFADDLPLMDWLENHIWPAEAGLDDEDIYWGTRLACLEMIRSGTIRFWDMYWRPLVVARAVADSGLRATIGAPLIDGGPHAADQSSQDRLRAEAMETVAALEDIALPGIDVALAPHAIYTVSDDSLEWLGGLANERRIPIEIHLSETEGEVLDCVERCGLRPAALLDRLGVLGPRTVLAHGVWLDEAERELIAASGATIATNPAANMKLGVGGPFDYPAASRAGIAVGLGTDGAGSNNSLDMLADAKLFALLQKHHARDPAVASAAETWEIATGRRSELLGGGSIEVGARADLILLRAGDPALAVGSLDAGLVYAASDSAVHSTIVAGRILMRDGVIDGAAEVVAAAAERARGLDRG